MSEPPQSHPFGPVGGHVQEAEAHLDAAESERVDGALGPAKSVFVGLVRRATWHQRAFDRVIVRALQVIGSELEAIAHARRREDVRMAGIEEGLTRLDERMQRMEQRAARTEALLATLATDLHEIRGAMGESAAARDD